MVKMKFTKDFKPAWWLPGGHLQTLWPNVVSRKYQLDITRERLQLSDGDFIDLDWLGIDNAKPLVILLHGLEGSIRSSNYAKGMLKALAKAGFQAVFMHFRGCSGEHNKYIRAYHAGETKDFDFVLKTIRKRHPSIPIAAIGFSLGGNVLLKYLGETQDSNSLCCAVAISIPFEINRFADRIQKGFSALYQKLLISQLRNKLKDKNKKNPFPIDLNGIDQVKSFWEFDNLITAPLYGFEDVNEYYKLASSKPYLHHIKKPTLIIHAFDDPFIYADAIPHQNKLPENVKLELCRSGGHIGFVAGNIPFKPIYWLEERAPRFIKKRLAL